MARYTRVGVFLLVLTLLFCFAPQAHAATGKMDVSVSPSDLLGTGTVTVEITVSNTSTTGVLLEDVFVTGPGVNESLGNLQAGAARNLTINNFPVSEDQLGNAVTFTMRWREEGVGQTLDKSVTVKRRASNPKLALSRTADKTIAPAGSVVKFTYTLQNQGDVDLTGIMLTDPVTKNAIVSNLALGVGTEAQKFTVDVTMGDKTITSTPVASYIYSEKKGEQRADSLDVELGVMKVEVKASVTAREASGTRIGITINNTGNMDLKNAKLTDDFNAVVKNTFSLKAGESTTLENNVIATSKRNVVYTLNGADPLGNAYKVSSSGVSVVPYVDTASVSFTMDVKVDTAASKTEGKTALTVTLHNPSSVVLQDVVISEATLGDLETLPYLDTGDKTVSLLVDNVASGQWVFSAIALDVAGNQYSAAAEPLAVLSTSPTGEPATPGATPDMQPGQEDDLTDVEEAAGGTTSTLMTIMIIIIVLIVLAVGALILLRMQEKKQGKSGEGDFGELEALLEKPVRQPRGGMSARTERDADERQSVTSATVAKERIQAKPSRPAAAPKAADKPVRVTRESAKKPDTYEPVVRTARRSEPEREPEPKPAYQPQTRQEPAAPVFERPKAAYQPPEYQPPEKPAYQPPTPAWQPPTRPDPGRAPVRSFGPQPRPAPSYMQRSQYDVSNDFDGNDFDGDINDTANEFDVYSPRQGGEPRQEETVYYAQQPPVQAPAGVPAQPTEEQEYQRGHSDGMNNQPYNSGGDSPAYDRGYLQGCKERSMR